MIHRNPAAPLEQMSQNTRYKGPETQQRTVQKAGGRTISTHGVLSSPSSFSRAVNGRHRMMTLKVSSAPPLSLVFADAISRRAEWGGVLLKEKSYGRRKSNISINLFDMTGKLVRNISNDTYSAGEQNIELNSAELAKGIYIIKLQQNNQTYTCKWMVN